MKRYIILALAYAMSGQAFADVEFSNANPIEHYEKNKGAYSTYLNGVMNGFFWANAFAASKNNVKLFCLPENISPGDIDYLGILDRHISQGDNAKKEKYIEFSLVVALMEKFPCSN
jgi:hypothetical protein